MKKVLLAAAFAASTYAAPALSADLATLDCIVTSMPAAARAALAEGGGKIALQQAEDLPPEASATVGTIAAACQTKNGWSDEAMKTAVTYSIATTAYQGALAQATKLGVKQAPFLAALSTLSEDQRQGILKQDDASLNAFVEALIANGVLLDEKGGTVLGVMAAFKVMSDTNRAAFAAA